MERLTRTQAVNRRSALGELASDNSLGLEPLRTSGISPLPQDGELTPRTGEINIAVTSKWALCPGRGTGLLLIFDVWWRVEAIGHRGQWLKSVTEKVMGAFVKTDICNHETSFLIRNLCIFIWVMIIVAIWWAVDQRSVVIAVLSACFEVVVLHAGMWGGMSAVAQVCCVTVSPNGL